MKNEWIEFNVYVVSRSQISHSIKKNDDNGNVPEICWYIKMYIWSLMMLLNFLQLWMSIS